MATNPLQKKEHIPELQIVRAMAILGVLTVHASASSIAAMKESGYFAFYNFLNIFMRFGTPTFILLSSFVLFYSYYSRPLDSKLIAGFYKKRLLYIIVPYVVFSIIYFVLVKHEILKQPLLTMDSLEEFWEKLKVGKAYSHLYFIYISIQFYLLFPFVLAAVKRWKPLVHALIPLGFAIQWTFVLLLNKGIWVVQNKGSWSLSYFSFFLTGAALGIYYPKIKQWLMVNRENASGPRVAVWLVVFVGWLATAGGHVYIYYQNRVYGEFAGRSLLFEGFWAFQAMFAALSLILLASVIQRYAPAIISHTMYRLGQLSFGIYLIHLLVLYYYDLFKPNYGITWKAHFAYLGSWVAMLVVSWFVVALFNRFVPFSWMFFGRIANGPSKGGITRKQLAVLGAIVLVAGGVLAYGLWSKSQGTVNEYEPQELAELDVAEQLQPQYDAIVVGTDPEGVAGAVSAARNGLSVLLVEGRSGRTMLGGLMTHGGLNTLDLNYSPQNGSVSGGHLFLNKGIFQEFYDLIEGTSFDVITAANAFAQLVNAEPNIDLYMGAANIEPWLDDAPNEAGNAAVRGVRMQDADGAQREIAAAVVIDATQDGDIAAAAGAPYTIGREDIGDPDAQMAVTLVFKMSGVTQGIWDSFAQHKSTGIDAMSAWGFPDAKDYPSSNPERVRMRGLNIGRQNDGTMLINAMHIFNIDPLDPASVQEALEIGRKEAPLIVDYLTKEFKELKKLKFAGTVDELYVRETRHFQGEYRLTMADVLANRDHWDAVAYGSYDIDIQSTSHVDAGIIMMSPYQYGVPFRTLVPLEVDNLLVVGRAASFDTIPHGSARVIPVGMATAEAAGAAVKLAMDEGLTVRELSRSEELIRALRTHLEEQGMDLSIHKFEQPEYTKHPAYKGLVAAASLMMTSGSTNNNFQLDEPSNAQRFVYNTARLVRTHPAWFKGPTAGAVEGMDKPSEQPLSLEQAAKTLAYAIGESEAPALTLDAMREQGWLAEATIAGIKDKAALTNGEAFMLVRDILEYYAGVVYE